MNESGQWIAQPLDRAKAMLTKFIYRGIIPDRITLLISVDQRQVPLLMSILHTAVSSPMPVDLREYAPDLSPLERANKMEEYRPTK